MVSKVKVYRKNWRPIIEQNTEAENAAEQLAEMHVIDNNEMDVEVANAVEEVVYVVDESEMNIEMANAPEEEENQEQRVLKTVCHRDIAAARCILYKGNFGLLYIYVQIFYSYNFFLY